ncbi:MAG: hypothetical protein ABUK01_16060 [Leptospirales bacterium]
MSDHHKISPTAWLVAKVRGEYTELPYAQEINRELSKEKKPFLMNLIYKVIQIVGKRNPKKLLQFANIESRYLCIEDALPQDNDYVMIELAAGLSPRGINHAKSGRLVIETDLPDLMKHKEKILGNIYGDGNLPDNHQLVSINALNYDEFRTMGKIYQENGKNRPLYIVHEGLLPYFNTEEKKVFLENIASFLRTYAPGKGYWVSTDLCPVNDETDFKTSGAFALLKKVIEKVTKKQIVFFQTIEDMEQYLAERDFTAEAMPNKHILKDLVFYKKTGLAHADLTDAILNYQAFVAQPKEQI